MASFLPLRSDVRVEMFQLPSANQQEIKTGDRTPSNLGAQRNTVGIRKKELPISVDCTTPICMGASIIQIYDLFAWQTSTVLVIEFTLMLYQSEPRK